MLRVTFEKSQGGIYQAVCRKVSRIPGGVYLLEGITKAGEKPGLSWWDITAPNWKILLVEECDNGSEEEHPEHPVLR